MRIYPAVHYTMGGLWVDYNLMSTIPGMFVLGEANFSDHGANRLGASALMQGLADGYFIIPYTIGDYLAKGGGEVADTDHSSFAEAEEKTRESIERLMSIRGSRTVDDFHRELGTIMWNNVGMARNSDGLRNAITEIGRLKDEYWQDVNILGSSNELNTELERAGRVGDFLELGEFMAHDALHREESCGGHFREEHQTEDGEAMRNDEKFAYAAAWEFMAVGKEPTLHKESLEFKNVKPAQRSYK